MRWISGRRTFGVIAHWRRTSQGKCACPENLSATLPADDGGLLAGAADDLSAVAVVARIADRLEGRHRVTELVQVDLEGHLGRQRVRVAHDLHDAGRLALGERHRA